MSQLNKSLSELRDKFVESTVDAQVESCGNVDDNILHVHKCALDEGFSAGAKAVMPWAERAIESLECRCDNLTGDMLQCKACELRDCFYDFKDGKE